LAACSGFGALLVALWVLRFMSMWRFSLAQFYGGLA
jgi:hypothetical protein